MVDHFVPLCKFSCHVKWLPRKLVVCRFFSAAAHENGYQDDKRDEPVEEENKGTPENNSLVEESQEQPKESGEAAVDEKAYSENHEAKDVITESQDNSQETLKEEAVPSADVIQQDVSAQQLQVSDDGHTLTRKIGVPNNKVNLRCYLCKLSVELHGIPVLLFYTA